MSTSSYVPRGLGWAARYFRRGSRVLRGVESLGFVAVFVWQVLSSVPLTLRRYRQETMRAITDMTWGRGSVIVGGGTVPMMIVLGLVMGASVGVESFAILDMLGMGPVTGIVSAFASTRELAPLAGPRGFGGHAGGRQPAGLGEGRSDAVQVAHQRRGRRRPPAPRRRGRRARRPARPRRQPPSHGARPGAAAGRCAWRPDAWP
ncbi:ABC transporter permease, partial [Nocardia cyriacigeorgica]|uniref:ABC transporter permease n=1 Tax=Nocardia cyriacigeorgica TaxID=135487 RepID=UPI002454316F